MIKSSLIALLAALIIVLTLSWIYQDNLARLTIGSAKYFEINTPKQHGWRASIYSVVNRLLSYSPTLPATPQDVIDKIFHEFERSKQNFSGFQPIYVDSIDALLNILDNPSASYLITMAPGVYKFSGRPVKLERSGMNFPIVISGGEYGNVIFELDKKVGFEIDSPFWHFDSIIFKGTCDKDSSCDHAFHLKAGADNVIFTNNDFVNFNAAIKSNGEVDKQTALSAFPSYVNISHNRFYNEWVRNTHLPVTPIDVVGGKGWRIEHNFISDFAKALGNRVAYGAFLKGGSQNGTFYKNVVACSYKLPFLNFSDTRVGLSFGGGGTSPEFCQSESRGCQYEHYNGNMDSNVIFNCLTDVSVYINKSQQIKMVSNVLLNSLGINIANASSDIDVRENILHGNILVNNSELGNDIENNIWLNFNELLAEGMSFD